jgi:hypothetical protein
MSELILTEAEKAAGTWMELPDETVGQLTKHTALKFLEADKEMERIGCMSSCLILTGMMHGANAEETTITLEGTTTSTKPTGDWEIKIRRVKRP